LLARSHGRPLGGDADPGAALRASHPEARKIPVPGRNAFCAIELDANLASTVSIFATRISRAASSMDVRMKFQEVLQ
jgi:hypothetical protein